LPLVSLGRFRPWRAWELPRGKVVRAFSLLIKGFRATCYASTEPFAPAREQAGIAPIRDMPSKSLLQYVPREAVYHREPLLDDRNALTL